VNHIRFPEEDHLPDWAHRDNKVTKGERAEYRILEWKYPSSSTVEIPGGKLKNINKFFPGRRIRCM
jgi:hypothetical protein